MGTIILIPVLCLITVVAIQMFFYFCKCFLQKIGQFVLAVNIVAVSVVSGLSVAGLLKGLLNSSWHAVLGFVTFFVILGGLGYMLTNANHPIIGYCISMVFGVIDGYYLGNFLLEEVLPKYMVADAYTTVATFAGTILLTVYLFIYAKRALPPTGIDECDEPVEEEG